MKQETGNNVWRKHLVRIRMIHTALLGGILLIAFLAFGLRQNPLPAFPAGGSVYVFLVPIVALLGYFGGTWVFRNLMRPLELSQDLSVRLTRFQTASLLRYTCLEAATLLAIFAYLEEGYFFHLAIAASLILYFYFQRPTRRQMLQSIPLSPEEQEVLKSSKKDTP